MTYGIVISSYKYGHLAAHAIESVLSQSVQFDKIWFVDDGANDCNHLIPLYAGRVEFVLRNENLGTVANFNDMLQRVDTDYVLFLGADNWLRSDALHKIITEMYNKALIIPKVCVYDIIVTGELKNEIYKFYSHQMYLHNGNYYWDRQGFHHGSMLYHVKTAKSLGGYANNNTSSRTDEDQNLWDKFIQNGHKAIHLKQALLYYRRHKENFNKY
jgi:glycosyltransferase involved in cell wall biosynthesis